MNLNSYDWHSYIVLITYVRAYSRMLCISKVIALSIVDQLDTTVINLNRLLISIYAPYLVRKIIGEN